MRMFACLAFLSFLICAQSLKCILEEQLEVDDEEAAADKGIHAKNTPPGECTTPSWCFKAEFNGSYTTDGVTIRVKGIESGCIRQNKLVEKCEEMGDDCREEKDNQGSLNLASMGYYKRRRARVEGNIIVCCCNTDLCNGSYKTTASVLVTFALISRIFLPSEIIA